jgi:creatinase/prolidase-like protein
MRRGLISWSRAELPEAVLAARVARTQAAMAGAGLDALALYTNNTRTAAVSWLTGFVPYWSEGLCILQRTGGPMLVVALSNRVRRWIESVSRIERAVPSPRIGAEAGRLIAETKAAASVGVVELGSLRADVAEGLQKGGAGLRLSDATNLFERLRGTADAAEIALAAKAGTIAQRALAAARRTDNVGAAVAAAEAQARALGAEEIYMAAAADLARDRRLMRIEQNPPALGRSYALRATVAYKGVWIRLTRTFFQGMGHGGADDVLASATERFAAAVSTLPDERGFKDFPSWLVEGCRVAQPLDPLIGSKIEEPLRPAAGSLVSVQATIDAGGTPVVLGAPALLGADGQTASLLVQPLFEG